MSDTGGDLFEPDTESARGSPLLDAPARDAGVLRALAVPQAAPEMQSAAVRASHWRASGERSVVEAERDLTLATLRADIRRVARRADIEAVTDWVRLVVSLSLACIGIGCGLLGLLAPNALGGLNPMGAYAALGGGLGYFGIKPAWLVLKKLS